MVKSPQESKQPDNEALRANSSLQLAHDGDTPYEFPEQPDDTELPPYSVTRDGPVMDVSQNGFHASTQMTDEGRVGINIAQKGSRLSLLLNPGLRSSIDVARTNLPSFEDIYPVPPSLRDVPRLNLLIQVVGSRGDVQPFVALGKVLKQDYGHRVRFATHPLFKSFVEENGLEFFSLTGDPAELMAFMVKNPGLIPGLHSLKAGDVPKRRKQIYDILQAGWRSAVEPGNGMAERDATHIEQSFVADAIIANPPSFAHIHVAEALHIPLHLMFTMPWSATQSFPHPLANIEYSNAEANLTNVLSYALIDMFTWQGLGDLINKFRRKTLGLESVSMVWGPGMVSRLLVPHTYCFSPNLIPKPMDWGKHIDVSGFFFLPQASNYTPPEDLAAFLEAGPPPIYVGFGSIVIDDPEKLTRVVFDAIQMLGCRAIVSSGWGGVGSGGKVPDGVFLVGNCPHDWLFSKVSCVVHHGGAGTTSAGIVLGKPTVVVPFFGDQPFWGNMVARSKAGPGPIPFKKLTAGALANAIQRALEPETISRAAALGERIKNEQGTINGAGSFHRSLPIEDMCCSVSENRVACWRVRGKTIKLSAFAAATLVSGRFLKWEDLRLLRTKEWNVDVGSSDPFSGAATALVGTLFEVLGGFKNAAYQFKAPEKVGEGQSAKKDDVKDVPRSDTMTTTSTTSDDSFQIKRKPLPEVDLEIEDIERPKPTRTQSAAEKAKTIAVGAAKGTGDVLLPLFKAPVAATYNVAQGFRNLPLMYGDDTVRPQKRITNIQSSLAVAGKEFGFGLYDGIAGLYTQPARAVKEGGIVNIAAGVGKGLGGFFFKTSAAGFGLLGYPIKGIQKSLQNLSQTNTAESLRAARVVQSIEDYGRSSDEEKLEVLAKWRELDQSAYQKNNKNKKATTEAATSSSSIQTGRGSKRTATPSMQIGVATTTPSPSGSSEVATSFIEPPIASPGVGIADATEEASHLTPPTNDVASPSYESLYQPATAELEGENPPPLPKRNPERYG